MKKKLILSLLIASAPFMLAGCGDKDDDESSSKKTEETKKVDKNTKNISCVRNEDGTEAKVELEFNTKKNEFTKGTISVKIDLSDYDEDEIKEIKDNEDQFCDLFEDSLEFAEDCSTKITNKELKATFNVSADTLNEEIDEDTDLDDIVEDLEDSLEVECTVK